jgi:hypothetical protein
MKDGLASEEFKVGSLIAGVGSVTGALEVVESISAAEISANAIGASEQGFVGTGSPPNYQLGVLCGSSTMPSTTSVFVVFGQKFLGPPFVVAGGASDVRVSAVVAGSFLASGANGVVFHWAAFGSLA